MTERTTIYKRRTRFFGPFRQNWISICNRHSFYYRKDCDTCNAGTWNNVITSKIQHYFYNHHYNIWYWWVNRPNGKTMKFLKKHFPNIRSGNEKDEEND